MSTLKERFLDSLRSLVISGKWAVPAVRDLSYDEFKGVFPRFRISRSYFSTLLRSSTVQGSLAELYPVDKEELRKEEDQESTFA